MKLMVVLKIGYNFNYVCDSKDIGKKKVWFL